MIDPLTLSVSELAERWKWTPRQVLDYANSLGVPLYFMFDGLAFDQAETWLRAGGDWSDRRELGELESSIARNEAWLQRRARGETGQYDSLSADEARELRMDTEASKRIYVALKERLEQREVDRRKRTYKGLLRALPGTIGDMLKRGSVPHPYAALHPSVPVQVSQEEDRGFDDNFFVLTGRLLRIEPHPGGQCAQLSIDELCASTAEVRAIEAHLSAKATPTPAEIDQPATEDVAARNARWLADFDREERKAKRGAQARAVAAVASREGVKADTVKKGIQSAKKLREERSRDGTVRHIRGGKEEPASPWDALKSRPR